MLVLSRSVPAVVLMASLLFLSACESSEERAEQYYQKAASLVSEGNVDRAIVELRNALELNSLHESARRTMAELQLQRGNTKGAYRQFLRLAEAYPEDVDSRIILSELAFDTGSWGEFDRHGARVEELAPEKPRVQVISLVRSYRTAIADDETSVRRQLGEKADKLIAELPENLLLRNTLIDNAIRDQDFTRALAELDWMIEFEPTNSRNYEERLRILSTLGDLSAVEEQLREMMEVFPDDPAHVETLVRFFISRGKLDEAEAVLRDLSNSAAPDDPGPITSLIQFLEAFRGPEAVGVEIERALTSSADPIPFRIMQASFEFTSGNRAEAIATLRKVLEDSDPSEQPLTIKIALAKMLLATGDEAGARAQVGEVLAADESQPDALKMQSVWQIEADDIDSAIGGLRVALDQNPQDASAMTLIASAYARAGQPGLVRDFLAQAVEASGNAPAETLRYAQLLIGEERYLPAEDILLSSLRLNSTNIDILISLGQLYLEMEDFGRVRNVVDALRRSGNVVAIETANELEAERLNLQEGADSALSFLEELANQSEATLASKIRLVRARLNLDDAAGALTVAQQLREENADNEALMVVLAVAQTENGDLDAAAGTYGDLLAANSAQPRVWSELSKLRLRAGDREEAKAAIDEGLSHTPNDTELLWAKASLLERDGEFDAAIEIYEQLYEQDSSVVVVANNLASLLSTYRDDEASLDRAWQVARRFRGANLAALKDTYGWILHRRENSAGALPFMEEAAERLPDDALVQYRLGKVYIALTRQEDALAQFRKAVAIAGPADIRPQIEDARSLVQSLPNAETDQN